MMALRMDKTIQLKEFSTYRSVLMGVAIIFIMASHTLGGFAAYGIIGVEWFLVLSAIGQFYSLKNNSNLLCYYKKRLVRILPAYLIVAVPFFIINTSSSVSEFLIRVSGLNLALWGEKYFWFVTLILICYLLAPLYFRVVELRRNSFVVPFIIAGITFFLSFHMPKTEILVTRIPVFLLGMNLGKYVFEGKVIEDTRRVGLIRVLSIISVLLLLTIYIDWIGIEIIRLIYFLCAIPTLYFVLVIAKYFSFIQAPLAWIGAFSYEIYLVHQHIALNVCLKFPFPRAISIICSYAVAIIMAFLLHQVVAQLVQVKLK